jgi:hypothetical protein
MRRAALILVASYILLGAFPASAQTYQPTTAGLHALVTDDAAILPPPYAAKLHKQEADWKHGVGVNCFRNGDGSKSCYPDAKAMIATIQSHIFKMDGYVFADQEWSARFPIPPEGLKNLDSGMPGASTPIRLDQNIPQIVAPLNAKARAFNAAAKTYLLFRWMQQGGPPQANPQSDQWSDVFLDYAPNAGALPGVISIEITFDEYMHGAMHPDNQEEQFNWNLEDSRHIIPGDLFRPDTDWQLGIATAAIAAFAGVPQYTGVPRTPENMKPAYADPRSWGLLQSGLRIYIPSYLRCYMCGAGVATIPWSVLKPYLKPSGLVHNS